MMIALAAMVAANLPFLSPIFGSHMVLQRDRPNPIWGWTAPGTNVKVRLGSVSSEAVAESNGKWVATLPPLSAGGPYRLSVEGSEKRELDDIWMGEVWLCSGQSNMEFGISQTLNGADEVTKADHPMIRLFMVDRKVALEPEPSLSGTWKVCAPETVAEGGWGGFSGVAYHFGVELQKKLGVPIGLIQAAWGGTSGEAWTDAEALARTHEFPKDLTMLEAERKAHAPALGTYIERWIQAHDEGTKGTPSWSSSAYSAEGWEDAHLPSTSKEGEVTWYRCDFEIPADKVFDKAYVHLGDVAGMDVAWINGKQVGSGSGGWSRIYECSGTDLHPGRNVLAVRVMFSYGAGGLLGKPEDVKFESGDFSLPLGKSMKVRAGAKVVPGDGPKDYEPNPSVPTVLRYGMISPIAPLAMQGVIWYQGETNMGRGVQYAKILPALIGDWRKAFQNRKLSFHIVSLANWQERRTEPGDEYMAELRESQALTALRDRHSGIAMTYDIGDAVDIHPKDKKTVGHRLALCARALTYGEDLEWSGPVYRRVRKEGPRIKIEFDHVGKGLVLKGGAPSFAVAGKDRKWYWANASIEGSLVVVSCAEVPEPVAVRYAWQNNPPASLYNEDGLPAIPFRTDRWPVTSQGKH